MDRIDTVFIQNIISPYRARFFNKLNEHYRSFILYYMGITEPDKFWDVSKIEMNYEHWIDKHGLYLRLSKSFGMHFNPVLLYKIFSSKEIQDIILAVSWNDPTIFFILMMKRLRLTSKRIFFWAEANYLTNGSRKENRIKLALKRFAFNSVDGAMIIPGRMAEISFEKWNVRLNRVIYLPNVINDSGLFYEPDNQRGKNEKPIFIIPMRVIEAVKGGLNFFDAIGPENVGKAVFWIAGDGIDMKRYIDYINTNGYQNNIFMKGFCSTERMKEMYNVADAFLLPSFSDPSPLSLIEALNLHMPILCSEHCGNHFEAVEEGINGYTFSPLDKDDIRKKYELFMGRFNEWRQMGENSARIYLEKFETNNVVNRFVDQFNLYKK